MNYKPVNWLGICIVNNMKKKINKRTWETMCDIAFVGSTMGFLFGYVYEYNLLFGAICSGIMWFALFLVLLNIFNLTSDVFPLVLE
jgi:hypothetical protein